MSKSDNIKKDIAKLDKILGGKSNKEVKTKKSLRLLEEIAKSLQEDKTPETIEAVASVQKEVELLNERITQVFGEDSILTAFKDIVDAVAESAEANEKALEQLNTKDIVTALENLQKSVESQEFPTEVKVSNLPDPVTEVTIKNPQKEVKVTDLDKLQKAIEAIKIPDTVKVENMPEPVTEVTIKNQVTEVGLKKPKWWKQIGITDLREVLSDFAKKLTGATFKVDASKHKDPKEAISVKVVDDKGNIITQFGGSSVFYGGGGSSSPTIIGLKDSADAQIDPATKQKQDEMITAINGISGVSTFKTNDLDEGVTTANVTYVGQETASGDWYIIELDESVAPSTIQHATNTNNGAVATYSDAWTNRATLTYGDYNDAF